LEQCGIGLHEMGLDWGVSQEKLRADHFDEGIPGIPLGQLWLSGGRIRYQKKLKEYQD
jgi:hypothetical protein